MPTKVNPYESNLVEWIMITRSDPGGGIPRFMVERGTPGSIASDAVKFLDWAASGPASSIDSEASSVQINDDSSGQNIDTLADDRTERLYRARSDSSTFEPSKPTDTGVIAALTSAVRAGVRQICTWRTGEHYKYDARARGAGGRHG